MGVTQTARILAHLEVWHDITPLVALEAYGCFRLAARVSDLRAAGHVIVTEWVTSPNGARYARYRLVREPRRVDAGEQEVAWPV